MTSATREHSRAELRAAIEAELRQHWFTDSDREIARRVASSPTTVGRHRVRLEKAGEILVKLESGHALSATQHEVSTFAIKPSPRNDEIYDPISEDDPEFSSLVKDIRQNGILTAIIVSADGVILSGHRRWRAACVLGLERVPVRIRPDVVSDTEKFYQLLASCNRQRTKTTAEVIREETALMKANPRQRVLRHRRDAAKLGDVEPIQLVGRIKRSRIVEKRSLRQAIVDIVMGTKEEWPTNDRRIFYLLLNIPGLLRNDVRKTPFENNQKCYDDVTDMITRLRLDRSIPFAQSPMRRGLWCSGTPTRQSAVSSRKSSMVCSRVTGATFCNRNRITLSC